MSIRSMMLAVLLIPGLVAPYAVAQDPWPTKAWPTAAPESVGLDSGILAAFESDIGAGKYGYVDSLLVIRRGRLVVDRSWAHDYDKIYGRLAREKGPLNAHDPSGPYNYFNPWWHPFYRRGHLHSLQSVTKTMTSVIIGAAAARGEFPALETPVLKFFDESKVANVDARKRRLTIRHLLTMTGGLEWNEELPYDDPKNSCSVMEACADWVQYAIDRPVTSEPGEKFQYCSGQSELLAYVFRVATGIDIEEYAARHLFAPLGIAHFFWKRTPAGPVDSEGGMYLDAHDLAKIAYLFLRNGVWEGRQVVTADWVKSSVSPAVPVDPGKVFYGYKWWLAPYVKGRPNLAWSGSGFGGQMPIILPEEDLIIVVNAWNLADDKFLGQKEAIQRVLAALKKPSLTPGETE